MDLRLAGEVRYRNFSIGEGMLDTVNDFIRFHPDETIVKTNFTGTWMLVVNWKAVHPLPHGALPANASQTMREFVNNVSYNTVHP